MTKNRFTICFAGYWPFVLNYLFSCHVTALGQLPQGLLQCLQAMAYATGFPHRHSAGCTQHNWAALSTLPHQITQESVELFVPTFKSKMSLNKDQRTV